MYTYASVVDSVALECAPRARRPRRPSRASINGAAAASEGTAGRATTVDRGDDVDSGSNVSRRPVVSRLFNSETTPDNVSLSCTYRTYGTAAVRVSFLHRCRCDVREKEDRRNLSYCCRASDRYFFFSPKKRIARSLFAFARALGVTEKNK